MIEIRCGNCRRKLGEGEYIVLNIKCPRCGVFNQLSAERAPPARHMSVKTQQRSSAKSSISNIQPADT